MEGSSRVLKEYFMHLEKLASMWESTTKKANKHLSEIETLSEQLQAASSVESDILINKQFPTLRENVMFKTMISLEQELSTILNIVSVLDDATDKLNSLTTLIDARRETSSAMHPLGAKCKLLEYAYDCRQYYQAQYSGVKIALESLDFRDSNSIRHLRGSFLQEKDLQRHVKCCLLLGKSALADTMELQLLEEALSQQ